MPTLKSNLARPSHLSDGKWVVDILHDEQLELADAKHTKHYGRRKFGKSTTIVLWLLRVYVVLMMLIIIIQLWLGVHQ